MARARYRMAAALIGATLAAGCASVPKEYRDPRDPWQSYNRAMFRFNTDFDNAFVKPLAQGYQAVTPEPVNRSISNLFANLSDVTSAVNNLLQFKLSRAGSDVGRVAVNTTVGVAGLFDVATNMGIPSYKEDFGQTLGYWGMGAGPFMMLPVIGPSSLRDTLGFAGDTFVDPLFFNDQDHVYWSLIALRVIDQRAGLLTAGAIFDEAAIDRYSFMRDAFLERRRNLVHDGNPPPAADDATWDSPPAD